jgi:hypothetical protein
VPDNSHELVLAVPARQAQSASFGVDRRGLVFVATGLWAAFIQFFPPQKSAETKASEPAPVNVQADCSGIAIGGNVTGATITSGAPTMECPPKPK